MSSNSSGVPSYAETDSLAALFDIVHTTNYCWVSIVVLVFYEYILTFAEEFELYWDGKFTVATLVFMTNRYLCVCYAIVCGLELVYWATPLSCEVINSLLNSTQLALYTTAAVFSALRIHMIGSRTRARFGDCNVKMLEAAAFLLGFVPVACDIFTISNTSYTSVFWLLWMPVCTLQESYSHSAGTKLIVTGRVCTISADMLVLAVTLYESYDTMKMRRLLGTKMLASTMIFANGAIYFVVLLLLNILQMTIEVVDEFSYTTYFTNPISSILISKFLLNLRRQLICPPDVHLSTSFGTPAIMTIGDMTHSAVFRVQDLEIPSRYPRLSHDSAYSLEVMEESRDDVE